MISFRFFCLCVDLASSAIFLLDSFSALSYILVTGSCEGTTIHSKGSRLFATKPPWNLSLVNQITERRFISELYHQAFPRCHEGYA